MRRLASLMHRAMAVLAYPGADGRQFDVLYQRCLRAGDLPRQSVLSAPPARSRPPIRCPAFHDNRAHTLEEVVDFYRYATPSTTSITGAQNGFLITDFQRDQIALFVAWLNVSENIRSA